MDWLRAKVLFIAAFLLLDLFLAWEVSRLSVPVLTLGATAIAPMRPAPVTTRPGVYVLGQLQTSGLSPQGAPELEVSTVGSDTRALALLGPNNTCASAGPLGPLYGSDCRNAAGAVLQQTGGALVYSAPLSALPWSGSARAVADSIVRTLDPESAAFAALTAGEGSGGVTTIEYVETYDGLYLFDGQWSVTVASGVVTATRFWLHVIPRRLASQAVISAQQAVSSLGAVYGATPNHPLVIQGPLLFGYYYPVVQPPALPSAGGGAPVPRLWQLVPVWRVRLATNGCVYVNAYSGQPEQAPGVTGLRPVPC